MMHNYYDKLLLMFLILVFIGVGYHASHHQEDINSGYSQFVQQSAGLVLGALLALITKAKIDDFNAAKEAKKIAEAGGSYTAESIVKAEIPKPSNPDDNEKKG